MASFVPQAETQDGRFPSDGYTVASTPFAGRIGANQEFSVQSAGDAEVLEKTPDAAPMVPWKQMVNVHQFVQLDIWKAAIVGGVGR